MSFLCLYSWIKFFLYQQLPTYSQGQAFYSPSIVFYSLNKVGYFLPVAVFLLPLGLFYRRLKWEKFEQSFALRILVMGLLFPFVWLLVPGGFNYIFLQWHVVDRLLLLGSWLMILYHPIFVPVCLVFSFALLSQLNFGPVHFNLLYFSPALRGSILFLLFLYLKLIFSEVSERVYLIGFLSLVAFSYFAMGWAKIVAGTTPLEWAFTTKLHLGLMSFHFMGWLQWAPEAVVDFLYHFLEIFNRPLVLVVFFMELGVFGLFFGRIFTQLFLGFFLLFHVMSLVLIGIFFWPWMIVDGMILAYLALSPKQYIENLYALRWSLAGIVLSMGLFYFIDEKRPIAWWNLRSHYSWNLVVETKNGKWKRLQRTVFSPYQHNFSFSTQEEYLITRKFLPFSTYDYGIAEQINDTIRDEESFIALRESIGLKKYRETQAKMFREFVRRYIKHYQEASSLTKSIDNWLEWVRSPLITYYTYHPYYTQLSDVSGPVRAIHLRFKEGFFDGKSNKVVGSEIMHSIRIDD